MGMNRVRVHCSKCDKIFHWDFDETSELFQRICEKCGSEDIFYQEFEWEEKDETPLRLGERGCGTPNRFK